MYFYENAKTLGAWPGPYLNLKHCLQPIKYLTKYSIPSMHTLSEVDER